MAVVSRNPDRTTALGSILTVSEGSGDHDLKAWAVHQLYLMKSPKADAELERYMKEIGRLIDDPRQTEDMRFESESIRHLLARRSQ